MEWDRYNALRRHGSRVFFSRWSIWPVVRSLICGAEASRAKCYKCPIVIGCAKSGRAAGASVDATRVADVKDIGVPRRKPVLYLASAS